MKRIIIITAMLLLSVIQLAPVAATTWVADDVASLENAFANAADGDTISIDAGIYRITVPLDVENRSLTIIGAGAHSTIIDASLLDSFASFALGRHQNSDTVIDYFILRDFTIKNSEHDCIKVGEVVKVDISGCISQCMS